MGRHLDLQRFSGWVGWGWGEILTDPSTTHAPSVLDCKFGIHIKKKWLGMPIGRYEKFYILIGFGFGYNKNTRIDKKILKSEPKLLREIRLTQN